MPRDGTQTYVLPFPNVVADTTIESPVYNGFTNDIAQDLNWPRPILYGGTGATSAAGALAALGGETAGQIVTNYDSFAFKAGSFYSAAGATGAPNAHAFTGICYATDSSNMFVEARDMTTGINFVRNKTAGVWGAWLQQPGSAADTDAVYVNVVGDTMTGALIVNAAITSNPTSTTGTYYFGTSATKFLNYDGTNFNFSGGQVVVPSLASSGAITVTTPGLGSAIRLIDSTTGTSKYLRCNTNTLELVNNAFSGVVMTVNDVGSMVLNGNLNCASLSCTALASGSAITAPGFVVNNTSLGPTSLELGSQTVAGSAFIDFHSSGTAGDFDSRILSSGGSGIGNGVMTYTASGGHNFSGNVSANGVVIVAGTIEAVGGLLATGHRSRQGVSAGGYGANWYNYHWTGAVMQGWIDSTNVGNVTGLSSDYRIKKDVLDLPGMWDTVKALRPIKYTQADFSPPSHKKDAGPLFAADDIERWGFVAHELQATLIDSAAYGEKDSPDTVQSLNWGPLVAALTKALQEAMARIEALEAR